MIVNIDEKAGFCWGVVRTVEIAEETLNQAVNSNKNVYILGEIIHNPKEIERLEDKGLKTIKIDDLDEIAQNDKNAQIIFRAHGEPPTTYEKVDSYKLDLIDATCPLVTNLQNRVKKYHEQGFQIIIFGKRDHAEVIGLRGVCEDKAIIIKTLEEANSIVDFSKKTVLISQTTMDKQLFYKVKELLESKIEKLFDLGEIDSKLLARDTTCRAVTGREKPIMEFASQNDVIIFVSGKKSSNGKSLYSACLQTNKRSYFIEDISEIDLNWFENANSVGISGATSTPQWYMEKVKNYLVQQLN